jgi:hypothetical protein
LLEREDRDDEPAPGVADALGARLDVEEKRDERERERREREEAHDGLGEESIESPHDAVILSLSRAGFFPLRWTGICGDGKAQGPCRRAEARAVAGASAAVRKREQEYENRGRRSCRFEPERSSATTRS